ncbi:hypothetical protein Plhal710r2_c007g0033921 [Plasmopara halstedii]
MSEEGIPTILIDLKRLIMACMLLHCQAVKTSDIIGLLCKILLTSVKSSRGPSWLIPMPFLRCAYQSTDVQHHEDAAYEHCGRFRYRLLGNTNRRCGESILDTIQVAESNTISQSKQTADFFTDAALNFLRYISLLWFAPFDFISALLLHCRISLRAEASSTYKAYKTAIMSCFLWRDRYRCVVGIGRFIIIRRTDADTCGRAFRNKTLCNGQGITNVLVLRRYFEWMHWIVRERD